MLRLTNISKTFNPGTEDAKLALDNVSLHVRPGDFISIIGANGAGKSTLFGAIAGSFITTPAISSSMARISPSRPNTSARSRSAGSFRTRCAAARPA